MPLEFLQWIAIWFVGFGVAGLSETRFARPPQFVGWGVCFTMIVASRIIRSDLPFLPQPFGLMLVSLKYLFVGIGFAALARAMSPSRSSAGAETLEARSRSRPQRRLSNDAVVICFFHFPFLMLAGADLLQQKLMQQPSGYLYLGFAATVFACFSLATAFVRAFTPAQQSDHVGPS
jgi:hypothetical protein